MPASGRGSPSWRSSPSLTDSRRWPASAPPGGARLRRRLTPLQRRESSASLRKPLASFLVAEDHGVAAALEHDLEVAPRDRVLRPPAVDDAPFLADERDALAVDP